MSSAVQKSKTAITLKGSAAIVCDYLNYGINSILFQRGLYPPENFKAEENYGLTILMSTDDKIKQFLSTTLGQLKGFNTCRFIYNCGRHQRQLILPTDVMLGHQRWFVSLPLITSTAVVNETSDKIRTLLTNLENIFNMDNFPDWLIERTVNKIAVVITNVKTLEVMERWDFKVDYEGDTNDSEQVSEKPLKQIKNEIRDVLKQIASSVAYLPLLDCLCSFDIQIYTKSDVKLPDEWAEAQPANIKNAQSVKMRSFTTNIHKMETVVTYKNED